MKIPGAERSILDPAKVRDYLLSPSGRVVRLVVVWIVLNGEDFPRFVTAYPGAKS